MSKLSKFLERREVRRRGYDRGRPEDLWRELIAKYVPGRTFADVGCMWKVNGDYSFFAAAKGATAVTGIDVNPASREFTARNAALGNPVCFVQGDLNDPAIETLGGELRRRFLLRRAVSRAESGLLARTASATLSGDTHSRNGEPAGARP